MDPAIVTIVTAVIRWFMRGYPSVIATITTNKKNQDLINYRIGQLEEKVDQHNHLIDRMYQVERRVTVLEENQKKQ